MPHNSEVILAVIPGSTDAEQLVVVHRHCKGQNGMGTSQIELRQQTWGEGIGWFTQNSMPLEPHQAAQLRATLGGKSAECTSPTVRFRSACGEQPQLRVHAESA